MENSIKLFLYTGIWRGFFHQGKSIVELDIVHFDLFLSHYELKKLRLGTYIPTGDKYHTS